MVHKGGGSPIDYTKLFKNDQDLAILLVNSYSEDHFIYTFLKNPEMRQIFSSYSQLSSRIEKSTCFGQIYTFLVMYKTRHILLVLQIENLVKQDCEHTNPHKLAIGTKPSVSNPRVLFCTFVL